MTKYVEHPVMKFNEMLSKPYPLWVVTHMKNTDDTVDREFLRFFNEIIESRSCN